MADQYQAKFEAEHSKSLKRAGKKTKQRRKANNAVLSSKNNSKFMQGSAELNKALNNMSQDDRNCFLKCTNNLMRGASLDNVDLVRSALRCCAKITQGNIKGQTALMVACIFKSEQAVRELLSYQKTYVNETDPDGFTALLYATYTGHGGIVQRLLVANANVNQSNNQGETPLHVAAKSGHVQVLKKIMQGGRPRPKVDKETSYGATALYLACKRYSKTNKNSEKSLAYLKIIEYLLDEGACPNTSTDAGRTPAQVAAEGKCWDLVDLLVEYGAVDNTADSDANGSDALSDQESDEKELTVEEMQKLMAEIDGEVVRELDEAEQLEDQEDSEEDRYKISSECVVTKVNQKGTKKWKNKAKHYSRKESNVLSEF